MSWLNGAYVFEAHSKVLYNSMSKKGTKPQEYNKWVDPMARYEKPKLSREQLEQAFRQQQIEQTEWLFSKIKEK